MTQLYVSEVFTSIQGEGALMGTPSVFVRTSGCNLRCVWCDTPYTSWEPEGTQTELDDLLAAVDAEAAVRHVVITGGEPLITKGVAELADALRARGRHVTIETAGTVDADVPADLWSLSPKLSHSTPPPGHGRWHETHEARRLDVQALGALMARGPYQLKFVVAAPEDLDEIDDLLARLPDGAREHTWLMPQARSVEQLDAIGRWLVPLCAARGMHYGDRLQIRLFGDTRGT